MKNTFKEKNKLPLTFTYGEVVKKTKKDSNKIYFIACNKYQTDFITKDSPHKPLTRLL